jgi:hypothetical protein
MIISVKGTLIDTKTIDRITNVEKWECYSGGGYQFIIWFFNRRDLLVSNIRFDLSKEKEAEMEGLRLSVENLRDEICKVWSDNQSNIPKFDFK